MRKSTKMVKRVACLFLVVLMSIDSLAAIVGDSDGGAFVTKKEFEDLKTNFDEQIERYNNSLDNKIDGVIADYVDGLNVANKRSFNAYNEVLNSSEYIYGRANNYGGILKQMWNPANYQFITYMFRLTYAGNLIRVPFTNIENSTGKPTRSGAWAMLMQTLDNPKSYNAWGYVFDEKGVVKTVNDDDRITIVGLHLGAKDMGGSGTYGYFMPNTKFTGTRVLDSTYYDLAPDGPRWYKNSPYSKADINTNFATLIPRADTKRSTGWWSAQEQTLLGEGWQNNTMFIHEINKVITTRNIYNFANIPIYAYMDGATELETFADPLDNDNFKDPSTGNKYPFDQAANAYATQAFVGYVSNPISYGDYLWNWISADLTDAEKQAYWKSTGMLFFPKFKLKNKTTNVDLKPNVYGKNETTAKFNNLNQFKNGLLPYVNISGENDYAHYYGGLPLFNQAKIGEVEFKIKFNGTSGRKIRLFIKRCEFPNAVYSSTSSSWTATNTETNRSYLDDLVPFSVNDAMTNSNNYIDIDLNTTVKVKIDDVEKNVPYFLRFSEVNGTTDIGSGGTITYLSEFYFTG